MPPLTQISAGGTLQSTAQGEEIQVNHSNHSNHWVKGQELEFRIYGAED